MTAINLLVILLFFVLLLCFDCSSAEDIANLIEDITNQQQRLDDDDQHLQTFPTPPPIGTTTHSMMSILSKKSDKMQNLQIFNEKDLVSSNTNPYQKQAGTTRNQSERKKKVRDETQNSQIVAGIPDISDPCFRRYENSIIVNAQPYERRSSTGLLNCKSHCLNSQSGAYTCRSFVYDNINLVCDLFAHVGDQSPARLLKFQTRDYFEPTYAAHCLSLVHEPEPPSPPPPIRDETPPPPPPTTTTSIPIPLPFNDDTSQCPRGKLPAFLRTEGFELFNHDDEQIDALDPAQCAATCKSNMINGRRVDCKSFDFISTTSKCSFTSEAAVPVGNGQLKQRDDAVYHEKICASQQFVESCPTSFFSRHPQMILVGFAESVADSPSFEHCFDTCLNSWQLFGFNCTSGMYYFEETQLNCILNSENRQTQRDLFTEENTDIVDYFEVGCKSTSRRKMAGVRNFETDAIGSDKMIVAAAPSSRLEDDGSRWESWSECIDGKQTRRKSCATFNSIEDCAEEVRDCPSDSIPDSVPTKEEIAQVKQTIRRDGFRCPLNTCCKVFRSCSYGLRHNSHTKQLEWCKRPCDEMVQSKGRARLLR